jgi:hypothetical protein
MLPAGTPERFLRVPRGERAPSDIEQNTSRTPDSGSSELSIDADVLVRQEPDDGDGKEDDDDDDATDDGYTE